MKYIISYNPEHPDNAELREWCILTRMEHWELFDGPIEWYLNNPRYIVTEIP